MGMGYMLCSIHLLRFDIDSCATLCIMCFLHNWCAMDLLLLRRIGAAIHRCSRCAFNETRRAQRYLIVWQEPRARPFHALATRCRRHWYCTSEPQRGLHVCMKCHECLLEAICLASGLYQYFCTHERAFVFVRAPHPRHIQHSGNHARHQSSAHTRAHMSGARG